MSFLSINFNDQPSVLLQPLKKIIFYETWFVNFLILKYLYFLMIDFLLFGFYLDLKLNAEVPVIIGSGVDIDNIEDYIEADAFIIGSHFKEENK